MDKEVRACLPHDVGCVGKKAQQLCKRRSIHGDSVGILKKWHSPTKGHIRDSWDHLLGLMKGD